MYKVFSFNIVDGKAVKAAPSESTFLYIDKKFISEAEERELREVYGAEDHETDSGRQVLRINNSYRPLTATDLREAIFGK